MSCERTRSLVEPFLDGELAVEEAREVERHVRECAECGGELKELSVLGDSLRAAALDKAPARLVGRVRRRLRLADSLAQRPSLARTLSLRAASHFATALIGGLAVYLLMSSRVDVELASREIVAAHVRALAGSELTQVASSDPHTVGPWFAGRIDFAPRPRDLAQFGYPLVGGRVEYFQGTRAAVLVFRRRAHVINVFIVPRSTALAASTWRRNGYNIRRWGDGDLEFWAISDLNKNELEDLGRLLGES